MDDALIAAVYRRPSLYDRANDNYFNRQYITQQWTDIAQELGQEVEDVRKKWTRLRDYFQRNYKKMTALQSGPAAGTSKRWFLYDSLSFLIPYLATAPTDNATLEDSDNSVTENASVKSPVPSVASTSENMPFTKNIEDRHQDQPGPQEEPTSSSYSRGQRKRSYPDQWLPPEPVSSFDMEMMEALKDLRAGVLHSNSRAGRSPYDEDELYCLSLAPKMKTLDIVSKLECQAEINNVLVKYIKRTKTHADEALRM